MEPNESSHHHHQQQQQRLNSPYYHHSTTVASTGNVVPSSNNGLFPPPQSQSNDGSSSIAVYPHSVQSSAMTAPIEPVKRKRGRPRKYVTPEQALAAKKMASSASREQAAAAGSSSGSSRKSQLGSVGKTGQSFTLHIVSIAPGEDVAQKIVLFANQCKHDLCVLSASGSVSNVSLRQPATSGGNVSYEGQFEILSLSGSFIRAEEGRISGGLSVSLSGSDGQIIGGAIGTHLTASSLVQVIIGTFLLNKKKDTGSDGKVNTSNSESRLSPPASTGPLLGMGMDFHPGMESSERNPMKGHDEQHHQTSLGVSHHFMMQPPHGMHIPHSRPSEWGIGGGNSDHDGRGGSGYNFSGRIGHESSENGEYEQQMPD